MLNPNSVVKSIRRFEYSHIREASRMSWNDNGIKVFWN